MSEIVSTIFESFSDVINSLTSGISSGFTNLIYADPTTKTLSDFAQFGFIFLGVSMAIGVGYLVVRLIRR